MFYVVCPHALTYKKKGGRSQEEGHLLPGGTIRDRPERRTSGVGREGGKHTEKGNTLEHCFPPMVERQKSCWNKAGETQMAQQKGTAKSPLPREEAEHLVEGRLMTRCN